MALDFARVTGAFFDSAKVKASLDAGTRKALSKCGAFVRTKSKTSLRYRKKASAPGQPPSVHRAGSFTRENKKTGVRRATSPLKELIYFAWDSRTKSVTVGPIPFARTGTPARLEHGGAARVVKLDPLPATTRRAGKAQAANYRRLVQEGRIAVPPRGRKVLSIPFAARPFMHPAMVSQVGKFPEAFRGVVR